MKGVNKVIDQLQTAFHKDNWSQR